MQRSYLLIDGKEISSAVYWRQRRLNELSANAKLLFVWLNKNDKKFISTVELTKRLMPRTLRRAEIIRRLMQELIQCELVVVYQEKLFYSGRWRREGWAFLSSPLAKTANI